MKFHVHWVHEARPDARWLELFERAWPAYHRWFLSEGDDARPDIETCRRKLRDHMPELVPMWEHLVELAEGDEQLGRMLSLYRPTPFLAGCSQAAWTRDRPMLVRNYDYHPNASEGTFLLTAWSSVRVIGSSDCLWGLLDGMNDYGLVAALSFGGSREVGDGFGIPLILRYILEHCQTVREAADVLRHVPSHMAYNVSLLDSTGDHAVAAVGPGRRTLVRRDAVATNHQRRTGWTKYQRATHSAERARFLTERLADPDLTDRTFAELFLQPPLYTRAYDRWAGTLYTAAYRPENLTVDFLWPHHRHRQSMDDFQEIDMTVLLGW